MRPIFTCQRAWAVCVAAVLVFLYTDLSARLPSAKLFSVFPPGGARGHVIDVEIGGADLDEARALLFSHPGISAQQRFGTKKPYEAVAPPVAMKFRVTIAADVPEGIYEVRAVGRFGLSNPRAFVVGHRAEVMEKEANNVVGQAMALAVGTTVNGRVGGATDVDFYRFTATKGQRVVIDCRAQRIDSVLDATLALINAAGVEIARSRGARQNDPVIDFAAAADGEYVVMLRDVTYRGGNEFFYRLSVSSDPYIHLIEPAAGVPGTRSRYVLYGRNLPGSKPAPEVSVGRGPLEMLSVDIQLPWESGTRKVLRESLADPRASSIDGVDYRLVTADGASNPVFIRFAAESVIAEREPNDGALEAQRLTVPCEVSGRFDPGTDRDWFEFEARKGDVYWIEVVSQRLGVPADPHLVLQQVQYSNKADSNKADESAKEIARQDDAGGNVGGKSFDTATDDVAYRFVVPADGTYRVMVHDLRGATSRDARHQYQLAIRRERPDFRLVALPRYIPLDPKEGAAVWNPFLLGDGVVGVDVAVFRRDGFTGAIRVAVEGLPDGVFCDDLTIPTGKNNGTLLIESTEKVGAWTGALRVVGRADIGGFETERVARGGAVVWPARDGLGHRSRGIRETAIAITVQDRVPLTLATVGKDVPSVSRAGTLEIPLKLEQRTKFHGKPSLSAFNLPANVSSKAVVVDGSKKTLDTKLTLAVKNNAVPGVYTFCVQTTGEFDYRRNPEAAERWTQRKTKLDGSVTDLAAKTKAAQGRHDEAVKVVTAAEAAVATSTRALDEARAKLETAVDGKAAATAIAVVARKNAVNLVKAMDSARKAAEEASAALLNAFSDADKVAGTPDKKSDEKRDADASAKAVAAAKRAAETAEVASQEAGKLAKAVDEARSVAEKVALKVKAAEDVRGAAAKTVQGEAAKLKASIVGRDAAQQVANAVGEQVSLATAARDAAAKEAKDAGDRANPKKMKGAFLSRRVTFRITAAPVVLGEDAIAVPELARGAKVEVPLSIARLGGFDGPVKITLAVPSGCKGVTAAEITVAQKQSTGNLVIETAADATPGDFTATLKAAMKFNKADLSTTREISLRIKS